MRYRVGLLGAGYICDAHAMALKRRRDVELVGVCDRLRDRAEAACRRFGIARAFASLEALLEAELDVVHVLLPPEGHAHAARRVLESGRHVFVEKPMAVGSGECHALVALARERGLKLGVNHNFLFLRSFERLRRDASDGTLGKLDRLTLNWLFPLALREPRSILFELGPHLVASMLALVGPLERVRATLSGRRWHVHGEAGGTAVDLVLSVAAGPSDRSIVARGEGALAKCYVDRDLYYREEPVGFGALDNFASAAGVAWQLGAQASANLARSLYGTLRKAPAQNPFLESIARSVDAFYDGGDARVDAAFGARVVEQCERILDSVGLEPAAVCKPAPSASVANPRVLIVGGSGFIGRHLVRRLAERGLAVRVATRDAAAARRALAGVPVDLVQGPLTDASFVDAALEGIEVVYYLAKADGRTWDDYEREDLAPTRLVAERALARRVKRFIYTSTIDSYYAGDGREVISAETPLDPKIHRRNYYARSKATCEALLFELHRRRRLPLVVFRPGIVIGSGSPAAHWGVGKFVSATRVQLWGDGRNPLPFVLVEDVAAALASALDRPGIEGEAFVLTDEPLLSGRDYVEAVSQACGARLRARPTPVWRFYAADLVKEALKHLIGHPNRRLPSYRDWDSRTQRARYDSAKARQALGWKPAGTREALIERGIREAVRAHPR